MQQLQRPLAGLGLENHDDKLVFVFDFDRTLTMQHSGGEPRLDYDYIQRMDLLVAMLERLYEMGIPVYINTRGIATKDAVSVRTYLKNRLNTLKKQQQGQLGFLTQAFRGQHQSPFKRLIKDVYGADSHSSISNPFDTRQARQKAQTKQQYFQKIEKPFLQTDAKVIQILKGELKDDSSRVWAHQKVLYLEKIAEREHVPKKNVYFFDDTVINVIYAKANGFVNSYRIFDGTDRKDRSLLTTRASFLEYTSLLVNDILDRVQRFQSSRPEPGKALTHSLIKTSSSSGGGASARQGGSIAVPMVSSRHRASSSSPPQVTLTATQRARITKALSDARRLGSSLSFSNCGKDDAKIARYIQRVLQEINKHDPSITDQFIDQLKTNAKRRQILKRLFNQKTSKSDGR